jgi:hypothetical protein
LSGHFDCVGKQRLQQRGKHRVNNGDVATMREQKVKKPTLVAASSIGVPT